MADLTYAVEIAAKGIYTEAVNSMSAANPDYTPPAWDALGKVSQLGIRQQVLPAVQALNDAGLLRSAPLDLSRLDRLDGLDTREHND